MLEEFHGVGEHRTRHLIDEPPRSYRGCVGDNASTETEIAEPVRSFSAVRQDAASAVRSDVSPVATEPGPEETSA